MGRSSSDDSSSSSSSSGSSSSDSDASHRRESRKRSRENDDGDTKRKRSSSSKRRKRSSSKKHSKDSKKDGKKGKKSKKSKKEKKTHRHKSRKEAEAAAAAAATGEDQALRRPAATASMVAALNDKAKWKAQVLEAAAKAQATLATGELQSQMSEMVGKQNNFGGDAVDWRAKAKLKKQMQAQKRMVAVGKQMMAKEKEDKARMREFMTAMGLPVEHDEPTEAERALERAEQERKAAARVAREQRERVARMKGPAMPSFLPS